MTSWDNPVSIATFLSSKDLESRSINGSPDISLIDDARSKTYDAVCIPLTTLKWRDRWREMCTMSSDLDGERNESVELRAEAWRENPVFAMGEVTITSLGMSFDDRPLAS